MVKIIARSSARSVAKGAVVAAASLLVAGIAGASSSPAFADATGSTGVSTPAAAVAAGGKAYAIADASVSYPDGSLSVYVHPDIWGRQTAYFERYVSISGTPTRCSAAVALAPGQFTMSPDLSSGSLTLPSGVSATCGYGSTYPLPDRVVWTADSNPLNSSGDGSGLRTDNWGCWGAEAGQYWDYVERNGTAQASSSGGGASSVGRGGLGYEYTWYASAALPPARDYC